MTIIGIIGRMYRLTERQGIELFHLLFLEHFGRTIDKALYALKGGCNLRFFLLSPRYSEDMDLDIHTVGKTTLQNKVERLLESTPFRIALKARGISIEEFRAPKQTDTTQRWKLTLKFASGSTVHTKIEFSRRGQSELTVYEPISRELALTYQLAPVMVSHYTKEAAFRQKLRALVGRPVTQARDLFDLYHLIQCGTDLSQISFMKEAASVVLSITFEDYCSLVVAYLPADQQEIFRSEEFFEQMKADVLRALDR